MIIVIGNVNSVIIACGFRWARCAEKYPFSDNAPHAMRCGGVFLRPAMGPLLRILLGVRGVTLTLDCEELGSECVSVCVCAYWNGLAGVLRARRTSLEKNRQTTTSTPRDDDDARAAQGIQLKFYRRNAKYTFQRHAILWWATRE